MFADILLLGNGTWKIWQNEEQWDKGRKRCWRDLLPVLKLLPYTLLPGASAEGESLKPGHASALCFLPSLRERGWKVNLQGWEERRRQME